jgi:ATP-dependent DNA helicase DinG
LIEIKVICPRIIRNKKRVTAKKMMCADSMKDMFGQKGRLSKVYPAFEFRKGQLEMARKISQSIRQEKHLLVEAGTGVGKTLAYLIPAIESGNPFIISTGTKNLQDQIFHKELPFIKNQLGYPITGCYMKGRDNYLCLRRFKEFESQPLFEELKETSYYHRVKEWAHKTKTGDRGEIEGVPDQLSFWRDMNARGDTCTGRKCPDYHQCFLTLLKKKALTSQIVIVNHHLFFADLSIRNDFGAIIPPYEYLVFDEAHMMEEIATQYFGRSASLRQFEDFIRDASRLISLKGHRATRRNVFPSLKKSLDAFYSFLQGGDGRYGFSDRDQESLEERMSGIFNQMDLLQNWLKRETTDPERLDQMLRRGKELIDSLRFLIAQKEEKYAYYYEVKGKNITLHASPIDVSTLLRKNLFDRVRCAILTSATLTVAGDFSFLIERLGIVNQMELLAESPFDYEKQAILFLPSHLPEPMDQDFLVSMQGNLTELLDISRGRAFVLFTSVAHMKKLYEMVVQTIKYPLFIQGELAKTILLQKFRTHQGAVLFATASFWHGVDVQGEKLSLVAIDKLPFDVPTDPLISARLKHLRKEGKNPFYSYQLPLAVITLKQGLGRLIRSTKDRGVLALFDVRILKRAYGKIILKSLPPFRITDSLEETKAFFQMEQSEM